MYEPNQVKTVYNDIMAMEQCLRDGNTAMLLVEAFKRITKLETELSELLKEKTDDASRTDQQLKANAHR